MEHTYRTLCQKLRDLTDLDEGRRDLGGIISRAAELTRECLGVPFAYAAATTETSRLSALSQPEIAGESRPESWPQPGHLCQLIIQTRQPREWTQGDADGPNEIDLLGRPPMATWAGFPIPQTDRPSGVLVVGLNEARALREWEREIVTLIAGHTATALANLRTFQQVESLSVTDDLTRVYNYRFMKAALRREVDRSSRFGQVFSILMLDVDRLKEFNEKHGHLEGSDLLRRLAGILARSSRAIDLVAKYGGDEFLLILPQTNVEGAIVMGRRICVAVAETAFPFCRPGDITVSIGVASFPQHGASMETLLAAADETLFEAKRAGRNCVLAAKHPGQANRVPKAA
ncbi:MAG TPA: sensor domain-containing diguanylate cyclase [Dongiaceae bacterium]|nr:sensor domain-containing diguanylate cyclase [Dongiaceae bacterium]